MAPDAWLPTVPQALTSPLVQSQKRVLQLQRLRARTSQAAVWNIRQKKVSFQLKRIIKKWRLLETQRRLEQLRALFWLPDDGASKAPSWVSSSNTSHSGSQRRSRWTTCSSLSLRRLCSQRLSRLHRYHRCAPGAGVNPDVQAVFFTPQGFFMCEVERCLLLWSFRLLSCLHIFSHSGCFLSLQSHSCSQLVSSFKGTCLIFMYVLDLACPDTVSSMSYLHRLP